MKERLIEIIRSVPITGKTYAEYVEAVADKLLKEDYRKASEVAREILEPIINALKYTRFASPLEKQSTLNYIYTIANKYTEEKG